MKKIISVLLAITLLALCATAAFTALSVSDEGVISVNEMLENEGITPGDKDETQRIYFQMPNGNRGEAVDHDVTVHKTVTDPETGDVIDEYDEVVIPAGGKTPSWYNEYNVVDGLNYAGVYWWGGTGACDSWVGYRAEIEDYDQGIYYADIPLDVVIMIFNAGVDGGTDSSLPIYSKAAQTVDFNIEGCDETYFDSLPYGSPVYDESYDGCILIIDPNQVSINAYSGQTTAGVKPYVYYGNGCYGSEFAEGTEYPDGTDNWSEDMQDVCLNPDHFVDGVHVGYHTEDPTEAPTEAPTEYIEGYFIGDADDNGEVESIDAVYVMRYDAMIDIGPVEDTIWQADVDDTGDIDIVDATLIQRFLADITTKFPIGTKVPYPVLK